MCTTAASSVGLNCYGARANDGTERCITVSRLSIDAAIAKEVLRVPESRSRYRCAVKAIEAESSETTAAERQLELSLQQARYQDRPCPSTVRCC